ncbi:Hypothetical protein I596_3397 [Dokdonella koreensis DS-123]|uniref:Uncharacterized protein n=1 Tax=Dokdonella koreensis DS-123 TaxID=1300342 RepID=A0A167H807_9GAMM|nr:Hypothetical protein I596_3397 [Dokdonella koreensis DS-123]
MGHRTPRCRGVKTKAARPPGRPGGATGPACRKSAPKTFASSFVCVCP